MMFRKVIISAWIASGFAFAMTAAIIQPHRVIANREAVKQSGISTVRLFTFA